MRQIHLNLDQVNGLLISITLLAVLLVCNSCMYLPLPAHNLASSKGIIDLESISLKQGKTTREDLLLLLGAPEVRHEQDRYFVYEWVATEAEIISWGGNGEAVQNFHYFCVEFDESNRIIRYEHFRSGLFKSVAEARQAMHEWMSKSDR